MYTQKRVSRPDGHIAQHRDALFFYTESKVSESMDQVKKACRPEVERSGSWRQFGLFFKRAKLSWGWIIIALLVTIVYYLVVAKLPGSTAGVLKGDFSTKALKSALINYTCFIVLRVLVETSLLIANAGSVRSVRNSAWKRMMGVETGYYDRHSAGSLLSTITCDAEIAVKSLVDMIVTIPGLIVYLYSAVTEIGSYNAKLVAVVFIMIPIYVVYAILMGKWQYKVGHRIQMRIGGLTGFLSERIRNLTLIKSFVTEGKEETNGKSAAKDLYKANVEYSYLTGVMTAYSFITEAAGIVIAVIWGCMLLRNGEIQRDQWLAFFLFVPTINLVLRQLTSIWANIKDVQGRAARLGELMDAPQEELNENADTAVASGDIDVKNVSFAYVEDTPILKNISFTIPEGKTTAIVGPSGSGKTTVLRLLEKLYSPNEGEISVGGENLENLNLKAWRDRMSYVNQDAELFSGTIREALTYGIGREVTDEELERVTKLSDIYDFIMEKPEGFDAQLAIWGNAMSGGQRQRMVIARELLKNADILLLDEPTSALDAETAVQISETFFRGFEGKTIVTITHELNFIAHADNIIVLRQGVIEAVGSHEELMEKSPTYRSLVEEQSYQEVFVQ